MSYGTFSSKIGWFVEDRCFTFPYILLHAAVRPDVTR